MTRPEAAASPQERLRARIRAEVARARPLEGSRSAIELIVESSTRPSGEDDFVILDGRGEPRFVERDGARVPFAIGDLLDEIRQQHPRLFEPVAEPPRGARIHQDAKGAAAAAPPPPPRDWLTLSAPAGEPLVLPPGAPHRVPPPIEKTQAAPQPAPLPGEPQTVKPQGPVSRGPVAGARATGQRSGRKNPWRRWPVALGIGAIALPVAAVLALAVRREDASPPPRRAEAVQGPSVAQGPAPSLPAPRRNPAENVDGPGATGAVPATDKVPLRGVPEVLDTTTLSLEGRIVRLFGVEWARGAGDPDDLAKYIRGREVACSPAPARETFRCQVEGQDLSRVILYNGGGRATQDATPDLKAAEEQARSRSVGVWGDQLKARP